jgi:hypothetical protein
MTVRRFVLGMMFMTVGMLPVEQAFAVSASTLGELVGYTVFASTNATGELEGADYDKVVKLDNGMIFEFETYDYFYAYHPDVIVFAKKITLPNGNTVTSYKLVIEDEDEVLDVMRLR